MCTPSTLPWRRSRLAPRERSRILRFIATARRRGLELTDEALDLEWRAIDDEKKEAEDPIGLEASRLFREQRDEVVQRLLGLAERGGLARHVRDADDEAPGYLSAVELFDLQRWINETLERLQPSLLDAVELGFETGALRIEADASFVPDDRRVKSVIEEVNSKIRNVPATTLKRIDQVIEAGLRNNETWGQIANRIRAEFDDFTPYRSKLIAQTSGTPAFEQGQTISWAEAGLNKRRGLSQRDGRVRRGRFDHTEYDLQEVGMTEPFEISGEQLMFPGDTSLGASPGNTISCRCSQLPLDDDD